ncbi:MAG: ABC-F family ATP-binding cassette domain-containing protein [Pontiellaceae bacterium]|nr:ABC-F family ATP-binding cassette domain-containing protein [Pontiellaceae bacterium]
MIDFIQVSKRFGTQEVLDHVSFRVNAGEHVGVVGPNGAGKSTVFSLISGELSSDGGEISLPKNVRLGHLHQQLHAYAQEGSLLDYTCNAIPELKPMVAEIHQIEHNLLTASGEEQARLLQRLGDLQHGFEHLGGYDLKARAEAALSGLGFKESEFANPFRSFSGGWQMRAELVRTLIARPDILLLDEPSNYLDLPAVEWLQRFLRGFEGTMLLISHDRYLLETLTDRTLEVCGGSAVKYSGGYTYYIREREQRHMQQEAAYRNYMEQKEHLESFISRFRAQATKAAQVQSRIKMLEKMEVVKAPVAPPNFSKLRIPPPPHCGAHIMSVENLNFSYDGKRWILRDVNLEIGHGQKIALVGFNGMGKTTLLRLLAGALTPQAGTRREGHKVVLGYQSQDFAETMPPDQSLLTIVRNANSAVPERDVRGLLGSFGFSGDAVNKPSGVLSGGEKIRLAFARIFINPPNFLLLDEPTTNLDIHGREALEKAVRNYEGTVCFVSHDIAFVRGAADRIVSVADGSVTSYPGGYDYYLEKTAARDSAATRNSQLETRNSKLPARNSKLETPSSKLETPMPNAQSLNPQAARKARAQEREAQKELRKMEAAMEALHGEQRAICEQLSGGDPELDYAALTIHLADVIKKLNTLEAKWLEEAERVGA